MAVEKETQLEAWLEENMPEPSGGNPNYVETINGTLANPWGEYDHDELWRSVLSRDMSLILTIADSSNSQWETQAGPVTPRFFYGRKTMQSGVEQVEGHYRVTYRPDGSFASMVDVDDLPEPSISGDSLTTLTIIHHPLPEN